MERAYINTGRSFESLVGVQFEQLTVIEHLGSYKGSRFGSVSALAAIL